MANPKRFAVALSFPGEHREFVRLVAEELSQVLGRTRVLYDAFYEAEFARPDLDTYLQGLYHDQSELIGVFVCQQYARKQWCGLEWRTIRDLIKRREAAAVMPLRFDAAEIPGLFSIDGYVWIGKRSAAEVAALLLQRLDSNRADAISSPAGAEPAALTAPPPVASPRQESEACALWRKKLAFLLGEEAIAVDPAMRFRLGELIREARVKVGETVD